MTTLVVANQKGGVGKTTTVVSLGAAFSAAGWHVLIVDLDPQANATSALGISKTLPQSIHSVLLQGVPLSHAVVRTELPGLDLLPSSSEMAAAEIELVPRMAREFRLREALRGSGNYDAVLVDCPPSLGLLTINALVAGEGVIVPVQCEYLALEGLAQLLETIGAVKERLNPGLEILSILLTMVDRRNRLTLQVEDEVRRHFPALLAGAQIPRSVRLAEAPSHGKPISIYDPASRAAHAYAEFAKEVAARLAATQPIALAGATA